MADLISEFQEEARALVDSARLSVCSHYTRRFIAALNYEDEEPYR